MSVDRPEGRPHTPSAAAKRSDRSNDTARLELDAAPRVGTIYEASNVKRVRRTKAEMVTFRSALYDIVDRNKPCSVRQTYYVGIGTLWDKDQGPSRRNYQTVIRNLGVMRESGQLPWDWLTDSTRYVRIASMYDSVEDALQNTAELYRRDLWARQPRRVEVWAESDSTSSLVEPVTRKLGVGLFSCRGQAGKEFVHGSAAAYMAARKPVTILYVGDWDPSGLAIPRSLEKRLGRYSASTVPTEFRRLAVTADDVKSGQYLAHSVNYRDHNYRSFATVCAAAGVPADQAIEVEAIPPPELRSRVEDELYGLVDDATTWNATLAAETSEREIMQRIAAGEVAL